ncbi:MAG: hypothetical protein H8F28_20215, partial [Fibrella sp.]|nr:hypothetical protein [Armatimonadota bacterium]
PSDSFDDLKGTDGFGAPVTLRGNRKYIYQGYPPEPTTRIGDCSNADSRAYGSYAINNMYYDLAAHRPPAAAPYADIRLPADTILIAETQNYGQSADFYRRDLDDPQPTAPINDFAWPALLNRFNNGAILARHVKLTNVIWCDGHAKAQKIEYLAANRAATALRINGTSTSGSLMYRFTIEDDER